jgi:hypothetical protein
MTEQQPQAPIDSEQISTIAQLLDIARHDAKHLTDTENSMHPIHPSENEQRRIIESIPANLCTPQNLIAFANAGGTLSGQLAFYRRIKGEDFPLTFNDILSLINSRVHPNTYEEFISDIKSVDMLQLLDLTKAGASNTAQIRACLRLEESECTPRNLIAFANDGGCSSAQYEFVERIPTTYLTEENLGMLTETGTVENYAVSLFKNRITAPQQN